MAPHGDRGRSPGDLWVLSIPGKYRAAGLTSRSLLLRDPIRTQDYKLKFTDESEKGRFHMKKCWRQAVPGAVGGATGACIAGLLRHPEGL